MSDREDVAALLIEQAGYCRGLGSPLYGALLERASDDVRAGGRTWAVLRPHADDPKRSMLALRLMGAVHRLVLEGRAPALAEHYPSAGGTAPPPGREAEAWEAFAAALDAPDLADLVREPVQTNEVGRSMALLGGFLTCSARTGHPLHLLEIGTSAGLNLRWDRFRYEAGDAAWGDPHSPVRFKDVFAEPAPHLDVAAEVVERRGCDTRPVDPTTDDGAMTLLSYVWPDQEERLRNLRGAIEIARGAPATIERADALGWLEPQLEALPSGMTTVVFHSIVLWYLDAAEQDRVRTIVHEAGARATREAPLAWLRMESGGAMAEVRLTMWPGGREELLAEAGYHGRPVRWLGGEGPGRLPGR